MRQNVIRLLNHVIQVRWYIYECSVDKGSTTDENLDGCGYKLVGCGNVCG